jgi:hypothetical protein
MHYDTGLLVDHDDVVILVSRGISAVVDLLTTDENAVFNNKLMYDTHVISPLFFSVFCLIILSQNRFRRKGNHLFF